MQIFCTSAHKEIDIDGGPSVASAQDLNSGMKNEYCR